MFVSVNLDDLRFVHKHANQHIVSALAWLEMPHKSVVIESTDRELFLAKATALDLAILYRNTTGQDVAGDHIVVREMLATLIEQKIKPTFAHLGELEAQIAAVEDDLYDGVPWKYALGSRRPAKQEDLFALQCSPLDSNEATEAAVRAPQRRKVRAATLTAAAADSPPTRPLAKAQRMPSVRPRIWAVADKLWGEAGKPTDKTVVLELRKKIMTLLETENGIKRTSSSNELGNWMKDRIA